MAYTAPSYDNVNFDFTESGYTAPAYNSVVFEFGGGTGWSHYFNGVSGSDIASLYTDAVDISNVASINGVE